MTDFYNRMLTDNVDNAEVVKALVDFQARNTKNWETKVKSRGYGNMAFKLF